MDDRDRNLQEVTAREHDEWAREERETELLATIKDLKEREAALLAQIQRLEERAAMAAELVAKAVEVMAGRNG